MSDVFILARSGSFVTYATITDARADAAILAADAPQQYSFAIYKLVEVERRFGRGKGPPTPTSPPSGCAEADVIDLAEKRRCA
jgi:hypothetical protein